MRIVTGKRSISSICRLAGTWIIACVVTGPLVVAQAPAEPATPVQTEATGTVTAEQINELQTQAAAIADLTEEQKSRVAELTQQALADLQAAEASRNEAARLAAETEKVPERVRQVEQELRDLDRAGDPKLNPRASITDLETERNTAQQRITELEALLTQPAVDPTARTTRRRTARQFLVELPSKLEQVRERLAAPPTEGEPAVLTNLRQARLHAERQALREREVAAQNELTLYDAEDAVSFPTLLRERYSRELNRLRKEVEFLTDNINRLRQREADARVREARLAAMEAQPVLKPILEANKQIAGEESEIRKKHEIVQKADKELEQRLANLRKDFREIEALDSEFGLSTSLGLRLRKLRSQLPNVRFHEEQQQNRLEVLEQAQFTMYERSDQLDDLHDIEAVVEELLAAATDLTPAERRQLEEDAVSALRTQHDYLDKVVNAYRNYTDTLTKLDLHEQELIEVTERFAAFIDERVLWVRSHRPLSLRETLSDVKSVSWWWEPATWRALGAALWGDLRAVPLLYAAAGTLLLFLLMMQRRMARRLHEVTRQAQSRVTISVLPTVRAVEFTILASMIWPGLLAFLAWRLWQSPDSPRIVPAAAVSLSRIAGVSLLLELVRQSMRPGGLCEVHFGLYGATARRIRQRLRELMMVGLPLASAVALTHFYNGDDGQAFIERLLFLAAMGAVAFFAHGLLRRGRGDLRELRALNGGGWIGQLDVLWHILAVGIPLALAGLAAAGYYYSAQKLAVRCQILLCLLLGLAYLRAFLLRWLMLRHRRLRLQQLRERQAVAAQQTEAADETSAQMPEIPADEADLDSISRQSQRLVSTTFAVLCLIGVWMIWFDVVPAFRFLERWPLWEYETRINEVVTTDGEATSVQRYVTVPVTIAHLALTVMILVITMTAARNLPGLLEITILERLPIDRSTTYAVTALVRYSLVLIGILLASRTLGIGWSKVQWLAAALTFGLGFGLQEIFANFVSGIIILFEQPVRVGDVVTIDGVSGVVNRIRIRATTITDWDRKEYIVPNREFITGRLLNWTLSDKTNRLTINVGVAYGSDTELVRRTILSVAEEHENVLEDPAPLVTFEGFGESALNFVLRAYLPSLDNRLMTIHDLHMEIEKRLRAAGIEIPFPQRDLHLRTAVVLSDKRHHGPNGRHSLRARESADAGGG